MPTIEIPKELAEKLSEIKAKEFLSGKGYVSTISFLVHHYEETKKVDDLLFRRLSRFEKTILKELPERLRAESQKIVETTMRLFFQRMFNFASDNKQVILASEEFEEPNNFEEEEEDFDDFEDEDLELSED